MRINFCYIVLIAWLAACTAKQNAETSLTTDTLQTDSKKPAEHQTELNSDAAKADVKKVLLNEPYLTKFQLAHHNYVEVIWIKFLENGEVIHKSRVDGDERVGAWTLSGSTLQIAFDQDTAAFQILSYTDDKMVMVTSNELAEKLFGGGRLNYGEYSGYYSIDLHRMKYSAPYPQEMVADSWQVALGACDFKSGGEFVYGEADCDLNGTWKFDGVEFTLILPEDDCTWSTSVGNKLRVTGLSYGMMVTQNNNGTSITFRRAE